MLNMVRLSNWHETWLWCLYILYLKGGIYLDASIICIQSVTCAFDLNDPRLQGYEYPTGGLNMENYAMAVEKNNYIDFHCHSAMKPFGKSFNYKIISPKHQ